MASLTGTPVQTLSERGKRATVPSLPYIDAFLSSLGNQYHPETNKDGVVCLCVAENKLSEAEVVNLFTPLVTHNENSER